MRGSRPRKLLTISISATLPPRAQFVATLLGQFQAPLYGLLRVLNGPLKGFGGILQARILQLESQEADG